MVALQFRCWKVKKVCGTEAFATHRGMVPISWENCCEGLRMGLQIPSERTLTLPRLNIRRSTKTRALILSPHLKAEAHTCLSDKAASSQGTVCPSSPGRHGAMTLYLAKAKPCLHLSTFLSTQG